MKEISSLKDKSPKTYF